MGMLNYQKGILKALQNRDVRAILVSPRAERYTRGFGDFNDHISTSPGEKIRENAAET